MKKTIFGYIAVTLLTLPISIGCAKQDDPKSPDVFDKIGSYYRNYLLETTNVDNYIDKSAEYIMEHVYWKTDSVSKEKIFTPLKTIRLCNVDTYYMEGVNYDYGSDRSAWEASSHVSQALAIAVTAAKRNDPDIQKIAVGMTYYWVFNNYRNTNWWHNDLGAGGSTLANLALFTYDDLNDNGKAMTRSKIGHASFYHRQTLMTHRGTNLFDYADITVRSAVISKNIEELNLAVWRIENEITDKNLEGFQEDGSFFQHGQQVQIASYGKGVIRLGKVLRALSEGDVTINPEKMAIVQKYILRGLKSMTHKGMINYSAVSREHVRENNLAASSNNFSQFNQYLEIDGFEARDELRKYLDDLENKRSNFSGVVYFDKAKMIVANLDDVYMSFKGAAPNLTNTECVNDENELGVNLSYGTNTCVMDTGDEYFNIAPLWDYAYIPGTTSINISDSVDPSTYSPNQIDDKILEMRGNKYYADELYETQLPEATEANNFVYSSGEVDGVAYIMQKTAHHKENHFTVTGIICDDGMVSIGSGLRYSGDITSGEGKLFEPDTRYLHTTLDQCFMNGDVSSDKHSYTRGNVLYRVLSGQEIKTVERTMGNEESNADHWPGYTWGRNNPTTFTESNPPKKVSGTTYTTYFDYDNEDVGPVYCYTVQPKSYENRKFELKYLSKDNGNIHAIKLPSKNKLAVAFYDDVTKEEPMVIDGITVFGKKGEFKLYDY